MKHSFFVAVRETNSNCKHFYTFKALLSSLGNLLKTVRKKRTKDKNVQLASCLALCPSCDGRKWFYYRRSGCRFLLATTPFIIDSCLSLLFSRHLLILQKMKKKNVEKDSYTNLSMTRNKSFFWCVWQSNDVKSNNTKKSYRLEERDFWWKFLCDVFIYFSRSERRVKFVYKFFFLFLMRTRTASLHSSDCLVLF